MVTDIAAMFELAAFSFIVHGLNNLLMLQFPATVALRSGSQAFYIIPHVARRNTFKPHLNKIMTEKPACNFI